MISIDVTATPTRPRIVVVVSGMQLGIVRRPHPPQRPVLRHIHCFRQC